MVRPSIKHSRSTAWFVSALLLHSLAAAEPASDAAMDASGMSVIAEPAAASAGVVADDSQDLYLEVVLNGNPTRNIAHFRRDGARLYASADTLHQIGFRILPPAGAGGRIDVTTAPDVSVVYDEEHQRCAIAAPAAMLDQAQTVLNAPPNEIPRPQASPGLLLNYDVYASRDSHGSLGLSAYSELRAFNARGVLSSTELTRVTDSPGTGWGADSVRLDTTFSHSFVDQALSLRIGDVIGGALDWSRATRLGGIQLQRDFAVQPNLITFPLPAFYGQANLPSTVDLYLNGIKQSSNAVPAGPFQLDTVPVVNGNGQAQVVITDAMGRQSTVDFSFYTANQLLRKGLSDYSVEAGFARKSYGTDSFSYASDPAASGTWRRGITDWLTIEGHAEASADVSDAGAGAVVAPGEAGIVNMAAARSTGKGRSGSQFELGYNWRNDRFNFSIDSTRTVGDYRDVASLYGLPPPRRSDRVLAGITLGRLGSLGMTYIAQQYPGEVRSRYANLFYFRSLGSRCSLNVSANQNLDTPSERSVFVGLSLSFGNSISASVSAQHDHSGNFASVDASHPVNPDGGFGWRARVQEGDSSRGGQAELDYRGQTGQVYAGLENRDGANRVYGDVAGALVFMDSQLFAARRIDDAFAVVSTGVPGVPVMLENRPIGRTNAAGDLLVTPLNAYQRNKLAIDPMQLPADVRIDRVDAEIAPSDRAGTLVRFGITAVRAATIVLVDTDGAPLPLGTRVRLRGQDGEPALVGFDGIVYLDTLDDHSQLEIENGKSRCTVRVDYPKAADGLPQIGPLVCRMEPP